MSSQDNAGFNASFYKDVENEVNDRAHQAIGILALQLENLSESITQSIIEIASTINPEFYLMLQEIKIKKEKFLETMNNMNLERLDEVEQPRQPYQSIINRSEIEELIKQVKSIIKTNDQLKAIEQKSNIPDESTTEITDKLCALNLP